MKKTLHPFLLVLAICATTALSGQDFSVLLHTGTTVFPENVREYAETATIGQDETVDGHYYRLLQFHQLPGTAGLAAIAQSGIVLLEYIPHLTYVASLPTGFDLEKLEALGVRSVQPLWHDLKMSTDVKYRNLPKWSVQGDQLLAMLKFQKNIDHATALAYLAADGVEVLRTNGINNFLRVSLPISRIDEVVALPYVSYVELVPAPPVADDVLGRSLHRANVIDAEFPSGRHYTGEGVGVLCRDDGVVGPHIDFQGRIENLTSDLTGTHGDGVSGIMAGAGNLDPHNRGMAAGADLYVINYVADFLDNTMDLFNNEGVIVTNSSYSDGCNNGYTQVTATVDQQLYNNLTLLHVFSAGNSNNNSCGYGAGNQWGNITGGHKQGKNCIATANLYADATIVGSSSRGPAHDGRIKPDIAAHGAGQISADPDNGYQSFGGTSAASPGIAGITAQLHQAYRELNGGVVAEAPLLKAILMNTANDLGNKGPDFIFGWGHVNAYRAVLTLEEQRFFKETINPGEINMHSITIPDGVLEARVMVYWADPESTPMTTKSLVNNLDIWLSDGTGTEFNPWLLDPTPNPVALNTPATKGVDNLNNVEQVAIDNPVAGEYTLHVQGAELPFGAHDYYVVWEFRMDDVTVTYPNGGEGLAPGDTTRIHWDMQGIDQTITIAYSSDGGATWNNIAEVGGAVRMFDWGVPNDISGNALIRVQRGIGGPSDTSDAPFSIVPRPANVHVTTACLEYLQLAWDAVDLSAVGSQTQYEVYLLGDKYMELVGTTSDLFYELPIASPDDDHWLAVRAIGDNGIRSERTIAINYNEGLMNCSLPLDLAISQIFTPSEGTFYLCGGEEQHVTVELHNSGMTDFSNVVISYQLSGQSLVTEVIPGTIASGQTINYTFNEALTIGTQGNYTIEVFTTVAGDMYEPNNNRELAFTAFSYSGASAALDLSETFESGVFPPPFYFSANPDLAYGWEEFYVTGSNGQQTFCAGVDNYYYNTDGEEDVLIMIPVDLTTASEPFFSFDVAYAGYDNLLFDGLRIEVSECGIGGDVVIYEKFGLDLATVGNLGSPFAPNSADDWRNEVIDMSAFIGSEVVIKFVCVNGYGNTLLIDNINVYQPQPPVASFEASTTDICEGETIVFTSNSTGSTLGYNWDFGAGANPATSIDAGPVEVTYEEAGSYAVNLTVTNDQGSASQTLDVEVAPQPVADFDFTVDGMVVTFTNNSEFADSYFWNFGNGEGGISPDAILTYDSNGVYTVTLTATNDCGSVVYTQDVNIFVSGTNDLANRLGAWLTPNPSNGDFALSIQNDRAEPLSVEVLDVRGVSFVKREIHSTVGASQAAFDLSHLTPGVYFVKIVGEDGFKALRLVIE